MANNILFIILDTLRDDRINGERTCITPNIDSLISNGVNFTQSTCSVHGTISSLGSLFSSKWSFKTGLGGKTYDHMNFYGENYLKTIASNNYNIFTIIPKVISNLGFFKNIDKNEMVYPSDRRLNEGLGDEILDKILEMKRKEPWFCYIHLNDLHSPIIAPKIVDDKKFGKNQYDRTMSFIDIWIGKIFDEIDLDSTIVILTSDHGQNPRISEYEPTKLQKIYWKIDKKLPNLIGSLKSEIISVVKNKKNELNIESEIREKLDVFDDVIRVPLIIAGGNLPKNLKIKNQVNHIDIFPTIENLAGFTKKFENPDGNNLIDLVMNDNAKERPIYIESPPHRLKKSIHVIGIRTSEFKYFRDIDNPKKMVNLFNLRNDPDETKNIALESSTIINELEQKLQKILSNKNEKENQSMELEDIKKVEKELRKLGYL